MVVSSARIFSPLQPSALGDRQLSSLQKTKVCLDCGGLGYRREQIQVACSPQVESAASSVCSTHPPWCWRCLLLFCLLSSSLSGSVFLSTSNLCRCCKAPSRTFQRPSLPVGVFSFIHFQMACFLCKHLCNNLGK